MPSGLDESLVIICSAFMSLVLKYAGVGEENLFFFGGGERGEGKALLQSLVLRLV